MPDVFDLAVKDTGGGDVFAQAARDISSPGRGGRKITQSQVDAQPKQPEDLRLGIPRLATGMDQLFQTGAVEGSRTRGLHNAIVGGSALAAPSAIGAASSGLGLVAGLTGGAAGSMAAQKAAEAAGVSPEMSELVGDAGGALAGGLSAKYGPRALRAAGAIVPKLAPKTTQKITDGFSAMRDAWKESAPAASPAGNRPKILADILKSSGITPDKAALITPEEWEMVGKAAGLAEHPDPATVAAAIAEMQKPVRPSEIRVRRR